MNPTNAQKTWHSLSMKWITGTSWGGASGHGYSHRRRNISKRRKVKRGIISNFIPVEVVNAITGEVSKGYMRDFSIRRLKTWLQFHNHKAQVEQIFLSPKVTLSHLKEQELEDFPILIKLGKYQVPYLIEYTRQDIILRGKPTVAFSLKTADNLKYLEVVADRKAKIMKLFKKIKKAKKK